MGSLARWPQHGVWCAVLAVLACLRGVEGAGGVSIFALGTLVDHKQFEVMYMYYIVFAITIIFELTVHYLHEHVTTNSGQEVVHHIVTEVMILGGISAVLVVFENLGGSSLIDAPLFHYVHFVIFVMAILFIVLVTSLFLTIQPLWMKWVKFEERVIEIESDPSLCDQERTAFLAAYVKTVNNGNRMLACLCYFRQNLPSKFHQISFARYMKKMQRKFMLEFLHLTVTSWFFLGVLCALAAVTDWVTITISDNPLATIGLWVLIVGFGPLLVLIVLSSKVRYEFKQFCVEVQEMRQYRGKRLLKNQSEFFWRGRPSFSVKLIQVMLLYQVFYLATVVINFSYRLWLHGKQKGDPALSALMIIGCYAPSLVVFGFVLPTMLPHFTVLASLGEFIDHSVLLLILNADKKSGKNRRQFRRDKLVMDLATYMRVESHKLLLSQQNANIFGGEEEVEDEMPLIKGRDVVDVDPVVTEEDRQQLCAECDEKPASVKCDRCGLLCDTCDTNYHRLRHLKNHTRKLFDEDHIDNPLSPSFGKSFGRSFPPPVLRKEATPAPQPLPPARTSSGVGSKRGSIGPTDHSSTWSSLVLDSVSVVAAEMARSQSKSKRKPRPPSMVSVGSTTSVALPLGSPTSPGAGLGGYSSFGDLSGRRGSTGNPLASGGMGGRHGSVSSGARRPYAPVSASAAPKTASSLREDWDCGSCGTRNLYAQGRCSHCKVARPAQLPLRGPVHHPTDSGIRLWHDTSKTPF